jgi:hypothetical protein
LTRTDDLDGRGNFDGGYLVCAGTLIVDLRLRFRATIGAMYSGKLSLFLLVTLLFPTKQVVSPQRDMNAEETVAANFMKLRHEAGLSSIKRAEGNAFSQAACEAAGRGNPEKVWVENADYAAMTYSTAHPEDGEAIRSMATRPWKPDQQVVIGVCYAATPAFPSGRYWVSMGVMRGSAEKTVADLLSGKPSGPKARATTLDSGE